MSKGGVQLSLSGKMGYTAQITAPKHNAYIKTSNFEAEAERSQFFFSRFKAENVL